MSEPRTDQTGVPTELERDAAPDMLDELGPLAYGLFALGQDGSLNDIRSLQQSRATRVPAQADRSPEPDSRADALLDELGELDL